MYPHNLFTDSNKQTVKNIFDWYSHNHQEKAFIVWGKDEQLLYLSNRFIDLLIGNNSNLLECKWTCLFNKEIQQKISEHYTQANNQLILSAIHIGVDKNKRIISDIIIDPIRIGENTLYVCQVENKTYTKELEEIIVDSQKSILSAQLAAGLVHEIRNPLTSVKGFIQLIQAGIEQREEFYQVIINEIEHLEKITTELLQIAKPFKGDMKEEYIHELIQDISLVMNIQSNFDHITLDIVCDDNLLVTCNGPQIKQILVNLLLNAMEAMEDGGVISLKAYEHDGFAVIDIIDEGEGVNQEIIKELDQPFFTTKEKGTGLGLAITKHLLDLHEAKLHVKRNETKGSTFTVLLPITNKQT